MIFQCKNCGGNAVYHPDKKGMYCPYCDSEESHQQKEAATPMEVCPNCGGEVKVEEHTSATRCPYCDNYIILDERVQGEYEPKLMIPFKQSKDGVKKLMRQKFAKCVFAPTDFLSEVRLDTMEGDYVPFWLYDYDINYRYRGEGRKVRVWRSGETEYTETSVYDLQRDVDVSFEQLPEDASVKMPDAVMELMEPYDYKQLETFDPKYLSGFFGEKYNMPSEELEGQARKRMEADTKALVRQTIAGYGSISDRSGSLQVKASEAKYSLLPVWKYNYRYKEKDYPFYINGQTAKVVGTVPISKAKVWAYGATLWAVLTVILVCGYYGWMLL